MASKQERSRREIRYTNAQAIAQQQIADQESGGDLKVPDGMEFLKMDRAGTYDLDIVPFIVGANANVISEDVQEGDVHYELTYWQHRGVGPDEINVACLRNWGEKCPLCERAQAFKRTMADTKEDKATFNAMKAKLRTVMGVIDRRSRGKPKVELFAYSWHGFAKQLADKITGASAERMGYHNFFHLSGGKTVQVKMNTTDMGDWLQAGTIELLPRNEDLPESLLDEMPALDEMLIKREYDEIVKIADGEPLKAERNGHERRPPSGVNDERRVERGRSRDDEDEPRPARRGREEEEAPTVKADLEEGDYVLFEETRCKVVAVKRGGKVVDLEEEDSKDLIKNVPVEDCKVGIPVDEEPVKKKPGRPAKPADDDDEPKKPQGRGRAVEDDDEDDDEDEGWRKRKPRDNDEDPPPPVKRGPGRPRKGA